MISSKQHQKKILVGIDYTKSSLNAMEYAAGLALASSAGLVLFHMYDFPVVHTNAGLYMVDYRAIKREDLAKLELVKKKLLAKHPRLQVELINSNFSLKSYAEDLSARKKISAVVLGLEAKSKLAGFLWGTSGLDLAGRIDCPVLMVPESYTKHRYKKMLASLDYKQGIKKTLVRKVEQFAKQQKMAFDLLHIETDDELNFGLEAVEHRKEAAKWKMRIVKARNFSEGMKKSVSREKADLVVLFSRKHSLVYRLFSETNTKAIAFSSNVPVMAIHA